MAVNSTETEYQKLELGTDDAGQIVFEQLAWPSGGINATIEFVKAFSAKIISNTVFY